MARTATIGGLPRAFAVIQEMQGQDCDWGEDYRAAGSTQKRPTMPVGQPMGDVGWKQRPAPIQRAATRV